MNLNNIKYNFDGLIPAIIQDQQTRHVLMLGYMNKVALEKTIQENRVTFYSRSKQRLWTKGETSGNFLNVISIQNDCDKDALLIMVKPTGPTCHTGSDTCWNQKNQPTYGFLSTLETIITERKNNPNEQSYTSSLFKKGINKIAQKVGEEAVEVVIEAKDDNDDLFIDEASDLMYHYLILLQAKGFTLKDIVSCLEKRHK